MVDGHCHVGPTVAPKHLGATRELSCSVEKDAEKRDSEAPVASSLGGTGGSSESMPLSSQSSPRSRVLEASSPISLGCCLTLSRTQVCRLAAGEHGGLSGAGAPGGPEFLSPLSGRISHLRSCTPMAAASLGIAPTTPCLRPSGLGAAAVFQGIPPPDPRQPEPPPYHFLCHPLPLLAASWLPPSLPHSHLDALVGAAFGRLWVFPGSARTTAWRVPTTQGGCVDTELAEVLMWLPGGGRQDFSHPLH